MAKNQLKLLHTPYLPKKSDEILPGEYKYIRGNHGEMGSMSVHEVVVATLICVAAPHYLNAF